MTEKLDAWALGASAGIVWALCILVVAIGAKFGYGTGWIDLFSEFYIGFGTDVTGILIGALWAFVDGVIGGALLATFYNLFNDKLKA